MLYIRGIKSLHEHLSNMQWLCINGRLCALTLRKNEWELYMNGRTTQWKQVGILSWLHWLCVVSNGSLKGAFQGTEKHHS